MKRRGFTITELLVTVTIISILASLVMGAYSMAQNSAKEYATKATIAKLNNIIMERYESYMTRRVPISTAGKSPAEAARMRLDAIRDLMRMEMPDAKSDVANGPVSFTWGNVDEPSLHKLYASNPPTADHDSAQCLYMVISIGSPEAMEQFRQDEIGTVDGRPCFVDGWRHPIMWLRWAPGFRSPIQSGDPVADHDPFDSRKIDADAFLLVPLIYSAGGDGVYDIDLVAGYVFAINGDPFGNMNLGQPMVGSGHYDNITNHFGG